jgi:hypothetical protein
MEGPFRDLLSDLDVACRAGDFRAYLQLLETSYVSAPPPEREALRALFRYDGQLDAQLSQQLRAASEQAGEARDYTTSLRAYLLRVSLTHRYDSRDTSLALKGSWLWSVANGLDPAPHFREIAAISSSEVTHLYCGSAQEMMLHVVADLGRWWPPDVKAVPRLTAALSSEECSERLAAVTALCLIGAEARATIPRLCDMLKDDDATLREQATSALCRMGAEAVPSLRQLLDDPDASARLAGLRTLGRIGPGAASAVREIMERVNDDDQLVCCRALTVLGEIGAEAKAAIPTILRALECEDGLIRINARRALREIDPEAEGRMR